MEYHCSTSVIVFYIQLGRDDRARVAWTKYHGGHDGILGKKEATELAAHLDLLAGQIKKFTWPSQLAKSGMPLGMHSRPGHIINPYYLPGYIAVVSIP